MINHSKKGDSGKRRETARNVGTSFCLSASAASACLQGLIRISLTLAEALSTWSSAERPTATV